MGDEKNEKKPKSCKSFDVSRIFPLIAGVSLDDRLTRYNTVRYEREGRGGTLNLHKVIEMA